MRDAEVVLASRSIFMLRISLSSGPIEVYSSDTSLPLTCKYPPLCWWYSVPANLLVDNRVRQTKFAGCSCWATSSLRRRWGAWIPFASRCRRMNCSIIQFINVVSCPQSGHEKGVLPFAPHFADRRDVDCPCQVLILCFSISQ